MWNPRYERFHIHIDFANRTFRWDSEATIKAHIHCVIVGFSSAVDNKPKPLYSAKRMQLVDNINFYLIEVPTVFVESRSKIICDVSDMVYDNKPTDGEFLFFTPEECEQAFSQEAIIEKYIRQIYGATEYINNKLRYFLWLYKSQSDRNQKIKVYYEKSGKYQTISSEQSKGSNETKCKHAYTFLRNQAS